MPSIRTKFALHLLNKHASAMRKLPLSGARLHFDKISKPKLSAKVRLVQDKSLPFGSRNIKIRIYQHQPSTNDVAILYFHGGGFIYGSLESHDSICRHIARQTGLRVIAVDYRLAPEFPYPAAVEDGSSVLHWLGSVSPAVKRVILMGDSAGANTVLQLALGRKNTDVEIIGQVLIYPALDPSSSSKSMEKYQSGYFVSRDDVRQFWKMYLGNAYKPYIWPLPKDQLATLPPTLIIGAECDVLHDEGNELFVSLLAVNVSAKYVGYRDMVHGFMHWPRFTGKRDAAIRQISTFCQKIIT